MQFYHWWRPSALPVQIVIMSENTAFRPPVTVITEYQFFHHRKVYEF